MSMVANALVTVFYRAAWVPGIFRISQPFHLRIIPAPSSDKLYIRHII